MSLWVSAAFAVAAGLVLSGLSSSTYALLTNERLRFEPGTPRGRLRPTRIMLLLIAGPQIILRNSWVAAARGARPWRWLMLSAAVAAGWSFCLGTAALNLLVAIDGVGG